MDEEMKRLVSCPFCKATYRLLVEGRKEGFFKCLSCRRRFVLPSMFEETQSNIFDRVMP